MTKIAYVFDSFRRVRGGQRGCDRSTHRLLDAFGQVLDARGSTSAATKLPIATAHSHPDTQRYSRQTPQLGPLTISCRR
jgi:hypothetical protein